MGSFCSFLFARLLVQWVSRYLTTNIIGTKITPCISIIRGQFQPRQRRHVYICVYVPVSFVSHMFTSRSKIGLKLSNSDQCFFWVALACKQKQNTPTGIWIHGLETLQFGKHETCVCLGFFLNNRHIDICVCTTTIRRTAFVSIHKKKSRNPLYPTSPLLGPATLRDDWNR
jgi:hypothetical protein